MTPHYKMIEVGGKELAVFYPQFKDDDGYKIIDLDNRFPIELKNHDEYTSFLESLIEREQELKDGLTTLADLIEEMDMLARGPKGDTRYMWVKYADDEQGSGMSDNPDGKKYIGMAFNKDTETPSDNPSDYKWVKYVADYEGLEIGGRNLIKEISNVFDHNTLRSYDNSPFVILNEGVEVAEWNAKDATEIRMGAGDATSLLKVYKQLSSNHIDTVEGETYTLSIYVKNLRDDRRMVVRVNGFEGRPEVVIEPNESKRITVTGVRSSTNTIQIQFRSQTPGNFIHFIAWRDQLEKGNRATDWSPAPEDIFARIDNVDKAHVGLSNVQNYGIASQSQAENGTSNSAYMTPLRTKQAIEKLSPNYVIDTEIGDDYILKKYSDGTFELKGHVKRTESLTSEINNMYRTENLIDELTPIMDDSYKLIYSNAWIMDGRTNTFLVMSSAGNPLSDKAIRYRIMGNNTSPSEDEEFIIGYEAYGTWS